MIDALRDILTKNYAALGWALLDLELIEGEFAWGSLLMRGIIRCPCGGKEYFAMAFDMEPVATDVTTLATDILFHTASTWHLKADVANGSLPAMDIEKHAFKGVLL